MDAEKEMQVVEGEPIQIILFGESREVKRLSIAKQREVIKFIQTLGNASEPVDQIFDLQIFLVSAATGVELDELNAKGDLIEISTAFKSLWKQNRLDYLLGNMAEVASDLSRTFEKK